MPSTRLAATKTPRATHGQSCFQRYVKISRELQSTDTDLLLELGYQALECDDLPSAVSYWREGVQHLIRIRATLSWENYLDGLAPLAARQGKVELAARLFGARRRRGYFHMLSPSERAARSAILTGLQDLLGEERFTQLTQEGQALTFMHMLAMVKEFLDLDSYT